MKNPYAPYLGQQNSLEVLAAIPARLGALVESLGKERTNRAPAPGKWSAREILCHLADCEMAFGFRIRQIVAEERHIIQPFDQDKWAAMYAGYDAPAALEAFAAMRQWNLLFLGSLPAGAYGKTVSHPERGEGTLQTYLDMVAGHDLNHLGQIEAMRAAAATG
jgi:uncharacterized damage-inducible protein DinB